LRSDNTAAAPLKVKTDHEPADDRQCHAWAARTSDDISEK
jgi:hypothetical protein